MHRGPSVVEEMHILLSTLLPELIASSIEVGIIQRAVIHAGVRLCCFTCEDSGPGMARLSRSTSAKPLEGLFFGASDGR